MNEEVDSNPFRPSFFLALARWLTPIVILILLYSGIYWLWYRDIAYRRLDPFSGSTSTKRSVGNLIFKPAWRTEQWYRYTRARQTAIEQLPGEWEHRTRSGQLILATLTDHTITLSGDSDTFPSWLQAGSFDLRIVDWQPKFTNGQGNDVLVSPPGFRGPRLFLSPNTLPNSFTSSLEELLANPNELYFNRRIPSTSSRP